MIARLRRWRLLTLVVLLATPGIAGTALGALHPCPESAPWLAAAADSGLGVHASHGGEHAAPGHGDQHTPGHGSECHCVGACVAAAAIVPPAPPLPAVLMAGAATNVVRAPSGVVPALRPSDRLPPSTAPPLA